MEKVEQEIVAVTYWFTPPPSPQPYPVTIKFSGQRVGVEGRVQQRDQFTCYETIDHVVPGSGPIAITTQVKDINPGTWDVTASIQSSLMSSRNNGKQQKQPASLVSSAPEGPLLHFWRWWGRSVESNGHATVTTCLVPYARTPGVILGSWFGFVVVGIILALVIQAVILAQTHFVVGAGWTVRIVGLIVGFIGAKLWFLAKHGHEGQWEGWCIQGFVAGTMLAVVSMLLVYHVAVGNYLDATAPGLLIGMAVGRVGCFFGGCCGGPPTAASWGVWSSDQRIGARRVPTQLIEAGFTLCLGLIAWVIVVNHGLVNGAVFVAGIAAYTLGRQAVLHLRVESQPKAMQTRVVVAVA